MARILVDIRFADSGQPFSTNFELTKLGPDVWRGDVPLLPRNRQLRFAARALNTGGGVAFSGETVAALTVDHQDVQIPLAPAQNNQTLQMPRMFRIVYPADVFANQDERVIFTIEGNAGATLGIEITPLGSPATLAAEFSPATATETLTSTVADFTVGYTPPTVIADTDFDYQVTITAPGAQSTVAVTTNFRIHVKPHPPGTPVVVGTRPSALFNPVILSLTANGSETPGAVELVTAVSDDSAPAKLTYQWSYAPDTGTAVATFANRGQGNPGLLQGYTVNHRGTITLAVTDEHDGTTTLHYPLVAGQFADAIDHASVSGLVRIVAGNAHTCVLTGQSRVRCWGDDQFGQLGYGNPVDVGDSVIRPAYVAGDVPLPADPTTNLPLDPVQQLVAGNNHTCVLLQSGLVSCWGDNRFGQLGYGRTDALGDGEPVTSFGYVTLGALATRVAAGGDHTCAILTSGAVRCWGRNDFGQLGRGNTANLGDNETVYSAGDVDLGAGVTASDFALGGFHTCALLSSGAVRCWGRNDFGQLGYGHNQSLGDNEPINNLPDVSLAGTVRKLVAGDFHTCALTDAGGLRCWGRGDSGQLGQSFGGGDSSWGNAANELPGNLPGDIRTGAQVTEVAAGGNHTCALSSDSQLRCWGLGTSGQLGYGSFASQSTPPAVGINLDGVSAYGIAAGATHTCALRNSGTARCWGEGTGGRLGRSSTAASTTATGNVDIPIFAPSQAHVYRIRAGCASSGSCSGTVAYTVISPNSSTGGLFYSAANTNSATQNTTNFSIFMAAGQTITLGTCRVPGSSGSGDTFLRVLDPSSMQVAANDDSCGLLSNLTFTAGTTGTFQLRAGCFAGASCSGTVAYVLSGQVDSGSYAYSASDTASATANTVDLPLVLTAGQTITFGTCGLAGSAGTGDTFLRLFGPSGQPVSSSDNACGGLLSSATFTVPPGG